MDLTNTSDTALVDMLRKAYMDARHGYNIKGNTIVMNEVIEEMQRRKHRISII